MELQRWNKKFCSVFLLLFCLAPISCKKHTSKDLIAFDVNGNFPVKTLDVEEVADIEYVVLDITDDDYLFSDFMSMSDNFVICYAQRTFFFFDRKTGKPVSKVDRRGNGPEEYLSATTCFYSEAKDELFILDSDNRIKVYGKDGSFKRKFQFPPDGKDFFPAGLHCLFDYDEQHLLLSVISIRGSMSGIGAMKDTSFVLISKQDGLTEVILTPSEKRVPLTYFQGMVGTIPSTYFAVPNGRDLLLTDYSSDTVYRFTPDRQLIPVLVREPSIQKMQTKIFLHSWLETNKYLFFSTQLIDYDWNAGKWPPEQGYMIEKSSDRFFRTNIQMRDYKGKELILGPSVIYQTQNQHTGIIVLKTWELHAANKENRLSGKLKEVTDRLAEDDEYVFMILKFR